MISIGVHCIAYGKHSCAMRLHMISIVVQSIRINMVMINIVVLCIAYDKHRSALHCL